MDIDLAKKELCELCSHFYTLGWVSGTGGGIAIRHEKGILMAPSGVEKERIQPEDVFLVDEDGLVLEAPTNVSKLTEDQLVSPTGYILFYRRRELSSANVINNVI